MQNIIPSFTTDRIEEDAPVTTHIDDALGIMLHSKWNNWSDARREVEAGWLQELRQFSQQSDADTPQTGTMHGHIYAGLTRTKCMSAFSRITDIMFQSKDKHWGIEPTPIPDTTFQAEEYQHLLDEMKRRAEGMEEEIEDKLLDMRYDAHVKAATFEGCVIGTGCVKGVIPGVKITEGWQKVNGRWQVVKSESPTPEIAYVSVFDVYVDPYAIDEVDMTGVYERHIITRMQLSALRDDSRFDTVKINEILERMDYGNHVSLYHETERRAIAGITDTEQSERFDLLEYWGQVSGRLLQNAGVREAQETETYWANVWVCESKAVFARVMPMAKQRIPYNFFRYNRVPHQFWGIGVARMMRTSQLALNGTIRAMLDGMAMAAIPMAEVNVSMLKDGQDPNRIYPGQVWQRDSGDPSVPAIRFFQPQVPTGQLISMVDMFTRYADDETMLPAYTYGDNSAEINKTAKGMSMQMDAASLPIKMVVKSLEDGLVRPLIESLFDWIMEYSDNDDIKGDMDVNVLGTSAIMAKEVRSEALMQFMNLTSGNPLAAQHTDIKYLITEIARAMEIDADKAVPEQLPEDQQQKPPQDSALEQARAASEQVRAELYKSQIEKTIAETAHTNIQTQFSASQTAAQILMNQQVLPIGDDLLKSAGYVDKNSAPMAEPVPGAQVADTGIPQNTSPGFPPVAPEPGQIEMQQPQGIAAPEMEQSPMQGIETVENEVMV